MLSLIAFRDTLAAQKHEMLNHSHRITLLNSTGQTIAASGVSIVRRGRKDGGGVLRPFSYEEDTTLTNSSTVTDGSYWSSSAFSANAEPWYEEVEYTISVTAAASANGHVHIYVDHSSDGSVWPTNGYGLKVGSLRLGTAETKIVHLVVGPNLVSDVVVGDNTKVRRGHNPQESLVAVRGFGTISTSLITVHPGAATYANAALWATPATVTVSSDDANDTNSSGSGAKTVRLTGLSSALAVQSETITLAGVTEATSANTYKFIQSLEVLTAGGGGKNAGVIYAGTGTVTDGVPAVELCAIRIGDNVSATGVYAVPASKVLLLDKLVFAVKDDDDFRVVLVQKDATTALDKIVWEGRCYINTASQFTEKTFDLSHLPAMSAGTALEVRCIAATGEDVEVTLVGRLYSN